nr:hypothetical protein [uncultured Serratia sp.]
MDRKHMRLVGQAVVNFYKPLYDTERNLQDIKDDIVIQKMLIDTECITEIVEIKNISTSNIIDH